MTSRAAVAWLVALTVWSARHPKTVIAITILALILSIVAMKRTTVSGSLQDILGSDSPAAASLARITSEYRSLDELLILATLPANEPEGRAGQERLAAFAQRLELAIAKAPAAASMCRHVRYRSDPALWEFIQQKMLPAGAYYLDDAGFDALLERLKPQGMRDELARDEALISAPGPVAQAVSKVILRDPLRLSELIERRLATAGDMASNRGQPEPEFSDDRRSLLIRVGGMRPANDLNFAQQFTDQISELSTQSNTGGLEIQIGGSYAIAAFACRAIRADDISSTIVTIILVQLFFIFYYGRASAPLLIGGTAGAGILAAFGVHALFVSSITPLTAIAGATLAGLGVDYGIHYLSHYQDLRSRGHTSEESSAITIAGIGPALASACLTTLLGFAALWPARIAMLRDFALLGSLGLVGALFTIFTLMPALLALTDRRPNRSKPRVHGGLIAGMVSSNPRLWIALSLLMLAASIAAIIGVGGLPRMETDPTVMHPRPNPPLDATELARKRFSAMGETVPIEVRAKSPEELVTNAHDIARALRRPQTVGAQVVDVMGICSLLPDPRIVAARQERLRQIDPEAVVAAFVGALQESVFDPSAYQEYGRFLRTLVAPGEIPDLAALLNVPSIAEQILPRDSLENKAPPRSTILLARLNQPLRDRTIRNATIDALRRALADFPSATVTGTDAVAYELETTIGHDLPRTVAISLVLVILWLCIIFRRVSDVLLSFIPVAFSTICLIGFIDAIGMRLNAVNGVGLPLLAGIAVDSGVFFVLAIRHESNRPPPGPSDGHGGFGVMCSSVIGTTVTNMMGFATLYWTRTPAVRSLGIVSAVGIMAGLWATLFLLLPLLLLRRRATASPVREIDTGHS